MVMEREGFRVGTAPVLKQVLDSRGVTFGYMDLRSDMPVECLNTPAGMEALLVRDRPMKDEVLPHQDVSVDRWI